jgi:hypothetical protein
VNEYDRPIPARPGLPERGPCGAGGSAERLCSAVVKGALSDPDHECCKRPATVHIIWEDTGTEVEQGHACEVHAEEARKRWKPFATHLLGPCCGMPGSTYFIDENECRYEDGLPTVEPLCLEPGRLPTPSSRRPRCMGRGGMPDSVCGRILVGQGDDTYDPLCQRRKGHNGSCSPEPCPTCDGSGLLTTGAYHPEFGWSRDGCPTCNGFRYATALNQPGPAEPDDRKEPS